MQELIERLELAMERSISLNAAIARSQGWATRPGRGPQPIPEWIAPDGSSHVLPPDFTGSIDVALPGENITSVARQKQKPGQPIVWIAVHEPARPGSMSICGRGATEPLARRIAALKARATLSPSDQGDTR